MAAQNSFVALSYCSVVELGAWDRWSMSFTAWLGTVVLHHYTKRCRQRLVALALELIFHFSAFLLFCSILFYFIQRRVVRDRRCGKSQHEESPKLLAVFAGAHESSRFHYVSEFCEEIMVVERLEIASESALS